MTGSAIKDSMTRFRANPWSAQTAPAVTATLAEHGGCLTGGPVAWNVGLPPVTGGSNEGPSPTLYLLGALAGSAVALIHDTLAPQLGVRMAGVAAHSTLPVGSSRPARHGRRGPTADRPGDRDRGRLVGLAAESRAAAAVLATALPDLLALLNPLPVEARGPNKTEQ